MNCQEFTAKLDDYLDDTLSATERQSAERHIAGCPNCCQQLTEAAALGAVLRDLPVPPPSEGFEQRAFRQARAAHHTDHRRAFTAGFASALVAALALVYVLVGHFDHPINSGTTPVVQLAVNQTRTVDLVFTLPTALDGATLSMELPQSFEVKGYPGTHVLTWRTNLAAGRNLLTLPVTAISGGKGELIARIRIGNQEKSFRIRLQTAPAA